MAQKFIDGHPIRVEGYGAFDYGNQRMDRGVNVDVFGKAEIRLTPRGAKRFASLLWDEASKAEKAKQ